MNSRDDSVFAQLFLRLISVAKLGLYFKYCLDQFDLFNLLN